VKGHVLFVEPNIYTALIANRAIRRKLGDITTPVDATEYTADYSETGHVYVATWTPKTMTVSFYKGKTVVPKAYAF
jgi:hypothetical protein